MDYESRFTTGYSQINKNIQGNCSKKYKSPETPVWDYIRDIWSSQQSQTSNPGYRSLNSSTGRIKDNVEELNNSNVNDTKITDVLENMEIIEQRIIFLSQKTNTLIGKMTNLQEISNKSENLEIKKMLDTLNTVITSLKTIEVQKAEVLNTISESKNELNKNISVISNMQNKIVKGNKRKRKHHEKNKNKLFNQMEKVAEDIKKKQINSMNEQLLSILNFHRSKDN